MTLNMNRRQFIISTGAAGISGILIACQSPAGKTAARNPRRKKIALIGTVVRKHSHAQHFIDRFLEGYGWAGQWWHPSIDLVSLYIDQFPKEDLARERSKRFNVPLFPSIEEALAVGKSGLNVDGVIIIGEHGDYKKNHLGQTLYPRYDWFKKVVGVFESAGRSVPVFNDKHLSTSWPECAEMVADSKRLQFPFLAGSSLPVTRRLPAIDFPWGTGLKESLSICYGGVDSYDFHGLETAQCMSERRGGGETGVRSIQAFQGDSMWTKLFESPERKRLFLAALSRSHSAAPADGFTIPTPSEAWARKVSPKAVGYFIEHLDGLKTTTLTCNGLVQDFTYAGLTVADQIISCQMQLPMPTVVSTNADFFNPLVHHIEQMVNTGCAPYPIERTLLTSGMTLFSVQSLKGEFKKIETSELKVAYHAPKASQFWNV
ncbi:MAG: hypothetical protein JWM99_4823 [Verrucomicrobiales bacterium]|nr:hypothetical protein [Verrucomicrobiales bacterium]